MTRCPSHLSVFILTLAFLSLPELVYGRPASTVGNATIDSNNNDPKIHCDRTHWYDICLFFFTNYILHALSVRSLPGESFYSATVFKLCCLLIPYAGLRRGLFLISRAGNLAGNDLQAAARASALCMVIRKPDCRPRVGDEVSGCQLEVERAGANSAPASDSGEDNNIELTSVRTVESGSSNGQDSTRDDQELHIQIIDHYSPPLRDGLVDRVTKVVTETHGFRGKIPSCSIVDHDNVKIQGRCDLPEGYALAYIPADMKVYPRNSSPSHHPSPGRQSKDPCSQTRLASAHEFPRILFSLTQTVSGAYALYRARGSQIERYGYAAFGLTVLPFIVISIINFLGSFLTSEYETVFLIHSSLMDEMINRGGVSDGVVGSIHAHAEEEQTYIPGEGARMEPGINVIFGGSEGSLTCHESTNQSDGLESYSIRPWATPEPAKRRRRELLSSWLKWPIPAPKPPGQVSVNSKILIPSHPPFNRLPPPSSQGFLNVLSVILLMLAMATPYTIIGALSGFNINHSTRIQRVFTLNWLVVGQIQGYIVGDVEELTGKRSIWKGLLYVFLCYGFYCLCALAVVAQEIAEFGTCKAV